MNGNESETERPTRISQREKDLQIEIENLSAEDKEKRKELINKLKSMKFDRLIVHKTEQLMYAIDAVGSLFNSANYVYNKERAKRIVDNIDKAIFDRITSKINQQVEEYKIETD